MSCSSELRCRQDEAAQDLTVVQERRGCRQDPRRKRRSAGSQAQNRQSRRRASEQEALSFSLVILLYLCVNYFDARFAITTTTRRRQSGKRCRQAWDWQWTEKEEADQLCVLPFGS